MALPPGLRYAILRNNVEIPLIPVDQLPFQLQDLPQRLVPFQREIEGWRLIGGTQQPAVILSIDKPTELHHSRPTPPAKAGFLPPDHHARKDAAKTMQTLQPSQQLSSASLAPRDPASQHLERPIAGCLTASPLECSVSNRPVPAQYFKSRAFTPSTTAPDMAKKGKEYCAYWIRHNSCDYTQQGCRYKHEMPDRDKLKELGFPEVPQWYRHKLAISSGSSSWLRHEGSDNRRLSAEPSASRVWRPLSIAHQFSRANATKLPDLSGPEVDGVSADIPNLIDLDDTCRGNPEPSAPTPTKNHSSSETFKGSEVVILQPEKSSNTFAHSLRTIATNTSRAEIVSDSTAPTMAIASHQKSRISATPMTLLPSQRNEMTNDENTAKSASAVKDRCCEAKVETRAMLKCSGGASRKDSTSPKSKKKRFSRPRKSLGCCVEIDLRPTLGSSRHTTDGKSNIISDPSKCVKDV